MPKLILPLLVIAVAMLPACAANDVPVAAPSAAPSPASAALAWRPVAGQCHDAHALRQAPEAYAPVDCSKGHSFQTIYVGEMPAPQASGASSPELGSLEQVAIWADCDKRLESFFGGSWRDFRVKLKVAFPTLKAWEAGHKWFSCEAAAYKDFKWINEPSTGSLEGGARLLPQLRLACFQAARTTTTPVPCTEPHNVEYVGSQLYPRPTMSITGDSSPLHARCASLVDQYVGAKVSSGTMVWHPLDDDWKIGDNSLRCFLNLGEAKVSKSLKGVGAKGFPRR